MVDKLEEPERQSLETNTKFAVGDTSIQKIETKK